MPCAVVCYGGINRLKLGFNPKEVCHLVARVREGPTWVILDQSPPTRAELAALRDEMQQHYATKADLANLEARLIRWFFSIMLGLLVLVG